MMMSHRDPRGGTLIIDLRFRGVGRIKRVSGTNDGRVLARVKHCMKQLAADARLDILRAIRDHDLEPLAVYEAWKSGTLHKLPLGRTAGLLVPMMREWLERFDCSPKHRQSIEYSIRAIEKERKSALVAELPQVVDALRVTMGSEHPRMWNLLKSHAQAFVRENFKRSSPLYTELTASEVLTVRAARKPRPLTTKEMQERFPKPSIDPVDAIAWGMATTGMLQHEYWGSWQVKRVSVHIAGTKRAGRVRDVPLVMRPPVPTMHRRTFENKLRERCPDMEARDLRNTYATWLEDAPIPRTRRRMYLGHGVKDVSDLYERREIEAFLAEDAEKLKAFIAPEVLQAMLMEVVK